MPQPRADRPPAKTHYLPHNKISWSPPTVVFIKALTRTIPGSEPEASELSGWLARIVKRKDVTPGKWVERSAHGRTAGGLAEWLEENLRGRETTWLFTHYPAIDLITTGLPLALGALGFQTTEASLSGAAPWIRMNRGNRRICAVSSWSWLPHEAPDLAERVGVPAPKREAEESAEEWNTRHGRHELTVVSDAMLSLLEWWDQHELGKWSISGPSTGFHAMRHIPTPQRVVIDPDPDRVAADRAAIYGGRRGAWIVGSRSLGPFLELDFANAYPAVAAGLPLPSRRGAAFGSMALTDWRLTSERWGAIAEVTVRTPVQRWPVRFPGGTFCPVGEFRTVLAGPELADAVRLGCVLGVGPGIVHQLNYHLEPWARWIIATLRNYPGDVPVSAQLFSKSSSRTVIGKWAAKAYERTDLGTSPEPGWGYTEGWDHGSGTRFHMVDLAGARWSSTVSGDAEQAYPAILAWIESATRVRLTRVIEAVGEGCVIQCDTDGLIVSQRLIGTAAAGGFLRAPEGLAGPARVKWVLDQLDPIIAPLEIRIKKTIKTVRVLGPQHVQRGSERKFAGLPRMATEVEKDVYRYRTNPGLSTQLGFNQPGRYLRPEATVHISGPYAPGWVLTDGRVIPVECTIRENGANQMLGFDTMTRKPDRAKLAQEQHPALAALW